MVCCVHACTFVVDVNVCKSLQIRVNACVREFTFVCM